MAEEIIFKVGVNTGNSVKDLNSIEKELKSVDEAASGVGTDVAKRFEELNKKVASGTLTMRETTKAIKEYQTIALQAGATSPIRDEAIAQAAQLKDDLRGLGEEVSRLKDGAAGMQAVLQLGGGIAAGYGVMQGTMALVGVESEKLQETFVKLQAIQAVLAGIEQIRAALEKESFLVLKAKTIATKVQTAAEVIYAAAVGGTTGAMKLLRIAMLALPIVAIIAGIVALVSAMAGLFSAEEKAEEMNNKLTASYERQQAAFERATAARQRATQNEIDLAKLKGATDEEIFQLERDQIKENEAIRNSSMKTEKQMISARKLAYLQALEEGNEDLARTIKDEINQHKSKYKDLKNLDGQYKVELEKQRLEFENKQKEEDASLAKEQADKQKKAAEDYRKRKQEEAQKQLELDRTIQDLVIANIEDENQRAIAAMSMQQQREREELIKKYGNKAALIKELEEKQANELMALIDDQEKARQEKLDAQAEIDKQKLIAQAESENRDEKARLEAKLIAIQDDFYAEQELKKELAELEMTQQLEQTTLTEGEKLKIKAEYDAKIREIDAETAENKKKLDQEAMQNALEWTEKGLNATQELSDIFFTAKMSKVEKGSKAEENLAKKQFKVNKALQLSGAIMDGFKAITTSLAQSPIAIGPIPNPAGIASLAFAGITSAVNIAKIAATKFESSSGGSASVSPPSLSASGGEPQVPTQTTLTAGMTDNNQQSAMKVYVLDSDITAKQTESSKVETLATFGG
jgi:hypothetical protein